MKQITEILRKETQTLKETYFEMTKKWSQKYFNLTMSRKNWKEVDWCNYFGLTPKVCNKGMSCEFLGFPDGFFNTKESKKYDNAKKEIRSLSNMGLEKFIEKELKKAENHYESSLLKLAHRIELKKLNIDKMSVVTGYVGVNIDMTLSDGEKTVKAFTIIAEGDIQRPHYRYLVK